MAGIIVGFDGSDNAYRALEWAMREAVMRHASLTVMTVPAAYRVGLPSLTGRPAISPPDEPALAKARLAAEDAVAKIATELGGAGPVSVTVQALRGTPAELLVDSSADADLMVVGTRGSGGFARLLMGSVSAQVVHYAHCPVVVVPGRR
jgi:nucleotide-binding universal stress UspA family protein